VDAASVAALVASWSDPADGEAAKSQELILGLLRGTPAPFSRDQFEPGHLTGTACVLHPSEPAVLLVHHAKLDRWLLPGGHVEIGIDTDPASTARREAEEESGVQIDASATPRLVGLDVHFIPARKKDPFHLHHDLIYRFQASSPVLGGSEEVREVFWCGVDSFDRFDVPAPIRRAVQRSFGEAVNSPSSASAHR